MRPPCGCWWSCSCPGACFRGGLWSWGEQKAREGGCGASVHLWHWDVERWMSSDVGIKTRCITSALLECKQGEERGKVVAWGKLKGQR